MRLLIISDTHGHTDALQALLKRYAREVQAVCHLGDHDYDLLQYASGGRVPFYTVAGNCDDESLSRRERILILNERRIFMAHGHTYGVKSGMQRLFTRARECAADICLFGHTHQSAAYYQQGIFFMNPGSLTEPRDTKPPSYAFLDINDTDSTITGEILFL